jgi:DnaJ family protein A protein 2
MSSETHYDTLEVPETATPAEIKKAYRRLSLVHHPDKNRGNTDVSGKFQKINEAYEILSDENKRREYDFERKSTPFGAGLQARDIDEFFNNLFFGGQMRGFAPMNMSGQGQNFGAGLGAGLGPNIKIFRSGGAPMHFNHPFANMIEKPSPIISNIEINMEQVLNGGTVPIEIERWLMEHNNRVYETETLYVQIPKGVDDGEIIVLKDKGHEATDECRGDVKVFIKVNNDSGFKRNGLDLIVEKTITLKEALCGFSFDLKYFNGKNYVINNTAGNIIKPGFKKLIPGLGLERDGHKGGIIIAFQIEFPDRLDEKTMTQLKTLL